MKSSVFYPYGKPVETSNKIYDARYATGEIDLVQEGSVPYPGDHVLEYLIVYHRSFKCYELTIFAQEPRKDEGWAWFYFPESVVYTAIAKEELLKIIQEQREFFRRRHRHFSPDHLERTIKYERLGKMLEEMVVSLLHYDMFQRKLVPSISKENLVDIFGERAVYKTYDPKAVSLLMRRPEYLIPVNTQAQLQATVEKQFAQMTAVLQRMQSMVGQLTTPTAARTRDIILDSRAPRKELPAELKIEEADEHLQLLTPKQQSSVSISRRASFATSSTNSKSKSMRNASVSNDDGDDDTASTLPPLSGPRRRPSSLLLIGNKRRSSIRIQQSSSPYSTQRILAAQAAALKAVEKGGITPVSATVLSDKAWRQQQRILWVRRRWQLAIRRVLLQNAVRRTIARLNELQLRKEGLSSTYKGSDMTTNSREKYVHNTKIRTNDVATVEAIRKMQKAAQQKLAGGLGFLSHRATTALKSIDLSVQDDSHQDEELSSASKATLAAVLPETKACFKSPESSSLLHKSLSSTASERRKSISSHSVSTGTLTSSISISSSLSGTTSIYLHSNSTMPDAYSVSATNSMVLNSDDGNLCFNPFSPATSRNSALKASYTQHSSLALQYPPDGGVNRSGGYLKGGSAATTVMRRFISPYPLSHQQESSRQPQQL